MRSVKGTLTEKNLLTSFAGESQARMRYTYFADEARRDGFEQIAGEESLIKDLFNACVTAEFVRVDSKGNTIFNLTNMSSLVFAASINGSNPHWIAPFSTIPMKIKSDVIELKILNMWCGEGKHPVIEVKL